MRISLSELAESNEVLAIDTIHLLGVGHEGADVKAHHAGFNTAALSRIALVDWNKFDICVLELPVPLEHALNITALHTTQKSVTGLGLVSYVT